MNRSVLKTVRDVLNRVRQIEGDMSVRRLQVLLEVAYHGELDLQDLIVNLDITPSSGSKLMQSWSKLDTYKQAGPNYIDVQIPDENMRTRHLAITPKGKSIVEAMVG